MAGQNCYIFEKTRGSLIGVLLFIIFVVELQGNDSFQHLYRIVFAQYSMLEDMYTVENL